MKIEKQSIDLTGVSETALLTLHSRASEARRVDGVIEDPMAVRLMEAMDVDFRKFGRPRQETALRAVAFDTRTCDYLEGHPSATVVALAEGLQTSFWRLDTAIPGSAFRWLTVDLPAVTELRARLLPTSSRIVTCAQSALDYSWMEHVDSSGGVFITAEGLLTYLEPDEALSLIEECARRFPGGRLLFDLPSPMLVKLARRRGVRVSKNYRVPPLSFGASASELTVLLGSVPGVRSVQIELGVPRGRGRAFRIGQSLGLRLPRRLREALNDSHTLVEFEHKVLRCD